MAIPREMIPRLEKASASNLEAVQVSPAGDALSWRSLDVDVYVPGLLKAMFTGTRVGVATEARGRR
jgi:hypothetical protein